MIAFHKTTQCLSCPLLLHQRLGVITRGTELMFDAFTTLQSNTQKNQYAYDFILNKVIKKILKSGK